MSDIHRSLWEQGLEKQTQAEKVGTAAVESATKPTAKERIDALAAAFAPKAIVDPKSPLEMLAASAPVTYDSRFGKFVANLRSHANKLEAGTPISAKLDVSQDPSLFDDIMARIDETVGTQAHIKDLDTLLLESSKFPPLSVNSLIEARIIPDKLLPLDEMRKHTLASDALTSTFHLRDNVTDIVFIKTAQPGVLAEVTLEPSVRDGGLFVLPTEVAISVSPL